MTAAWRHHMMHVDDLNVDQRWPCYQRHALEQTPIRSIMWYELFVDGDPMAALNFYADNPHAFTRLVIGVVRGQIFQKKQDVAVKITPKR